MPSESGNGDETMLLVRRMQALVRGALIRRSFIKLRAEFEEIREELEGGAATGVSTSWPTFTPCRPTFRSPEEDSDVLQRLAKKDWRKPSSSRHSEKSVKAVNDPTSPHYSSDFQSGSSSSVEEAIQASSCGSSMPPGSGCEEGNGQSHSENSHGAAVFHSPGTSIKEDIHIGTTEAEMLEHSRNLEEEHEENLDGLRSISSAKSDKETELMDEVEPPQVSENRGETIPTDALAGRFESESSKGNEDREKIMQRQSLNETDFTVVSSLEASSVSLSSSEDESVSVDAVQVDKPPRHGNVKTIANHNIVEEFDKGRTEDGRLQLSTRFEDQSASGHRNGTSATVCGAKTEVDGGQEFDGTGQQELNSQKSPAPQERHQPSPSVSSKADPSSLATFVSQSANGEGQAFHLQNTNNLPLDRGKFSEVCDNGSMHSSMSLRTESEGCEQKQSVLTSEGTVGRSFGAVGLDSDDSRLGSVKDGHQVNDHDSTAVADMTSIWSTDMSDNDDDHQVQQSNEAELREMRNNTAMELLWIQQAIESRKNYLRLKRKMNRSDETDQ